ncbi:MAG: FMN-dependent NADPH-azoreductase [Bacteroidetes bacterium ADurb.Bin234]|jgi:NAD(P)H-dependent FMN reductase|nr:MAG: FMN-dependent NADPH-azoreductase [Bacteroidetes bacterium ADurb.Bin234]
MKIIAFGASYSKHSINKQFATYASEHFAYAEVEVIDLNNYPLPLFTVDLEAEIGHPEIIDRFLAKIAEADLLIISMSEHNGSYTAAFKNLLDWTSRKKIKLFQGKKVLLISTSPGARGGAGSIAAAKSRFPIHGADIIAEFSLPSFEQNFNPQKGIVNPELKAKFLEVIQVVKQAMQ